MVFHVLGVGNFQQSINSSTNLNDCRALGVVYKWGDSAPTNAPYPYSSCLNIKLNDEYLAQVSIWRNMQNPVIKIRLFFYLETGQWSDWFTLAFATT